jgi:hypothetical protein
MRRGYFKAPAGKSGAILRNPAIRGRNRMERRLLYSPMDTKEKSHD